MMLGFSSRIAKRKRNNMIIRRTLVDGPGKGSRITRSKSLALVKQYGKAGIVTHYSCSVIIVSIFFTATTYGVDTPYWFNRMKNVFSSTKELEEVPTNDEDMSENAKWLTNLAVSVACYKLVFPVRAMITTALTPMVIR